MGKSTKEIEGKLINSSMSEVTLSLIGKVCAEQRLAQGVNQSKFGERIGKTQQEVNRVEQAKTNLTIRSLIGMLQGLDMTLELSTRDGHRITIFTPQESN